MLAIVGKARPNVITGDIEYHLAEFRKLHSVRGKFAYAWSFNPKDQRAFAALRQNLKDKRDTFLYLPDGSGNSNLRMRIIDFQHLNSGIPSCPSKWNQFCINDYSINPPTWAHIWFLIDLIEDIEDINKVKILQKFVPLFKDKYREWGQNYFAFLTSISTVSIGPSANQDFKPFINSTLRLGLAALEAQKNPNRSQKMFKLPSFSGKPIGFDVDNVHQLLSEIEGDS